MTGIEVGLGTPQGGPAPENTDVAGLVQRIRDLAAGRERVMIGIAGSPASGKSTLGEALVGLLGADAALVGMDGYHFADEELERRGTREIKGAPETFDRWGYVSLLRRLRDRTEPIVYAPRFDRSLEEPIGSAVPVPREVPIIITEGNYLLVDEPGWQEVPHLLDEVWFVDVDEDVRLDRLIARHMRFGRTADEARERSLGSDQRNAEAISATRHRASRVIRLHATPTPDKEQS